MIGSVIGNYEIRGKVGEGGMGAVYRGVDVMLEREVAVKVLRPELASTPQLVERFRTEAVALGRLNHPNIATLYSFLRHGDEFLMIMEFVRGETLDALIRRVGALPVAPAISFFCQALDGIAHAHAQGIVHRDLKPANLMLAAPGTIKVMDFGIARVLGGGRMTKTGRLIGTLEYMSPEQVRGMETDARSDIYSLGIVLYEMLTGQVPFVSESEYEIMRAHLEALPASPRAIIPNLPPSLEAVVLRALAKQPGERFQSAVEFRAALNECLAPESSGQNQSPIIAPVIIPPETRYAEALRSATINPSSADRARKSVFAPLYVKYDWKHYVIGACLLLLLGGLWGVLALRRGSTRGQSKLTVQVTPTPIMAPPPAPPEAVVPDAQPPAAQPTPERVISLDPLTTPTPASGAASARSRPATKRSVAPPPRTVVIINPPPAPTPVPPRVQPTPPPAQAAESSDKKKKKEKESKAGDVEKAVKTAKEIICVFKRC